MYRFYFFVLILFGSIWLITGDTINSSATATTWNLHQLEKESHQEEELTVTRQVKELVEVVDPAIDNRKLLHMLNESTFSSKFISFGTEARIYLGRWALSYESEEHALKHDYYLLEDAQLYDKSLVIQDNAVQVDGALTNKTKNSEDVKELMVAQMKEKMELPVRFSLLYKHKLHFIKDVQEQAEVNWYIPAVYTKGRLTYADVYLQIKGKKKSLQLQNTFDETISAWIPISGYVTSE